MKKLLVIMAAVMMVGSLSMRGVEHDVKYDFDTAAHKTEGFFDSLVSKQKAEEIKSKIKGLVDDATDTKTLDTLREKIMKIGRENRDTIGDWYNKAKTWWETKK